MKLKKNVFYVGLLSFFGGISQDIFAPILPIYLTSVLGFSKTFVGVAEGLVTSSVNLFKITAGFFADKFRRQKPIIFLGYFFSMISRPLLAFFTGGAAVLGLRFLDGAGKGIKDPPKDVLIAGSAEKEIRGQSFGIARMLDTLGSVAGPLLLFGLLALFKSSPTVYHNILFLSALPLLITLLILIFGRWTTKRRLPPPPRMRRVKCRNRFIFFLPLLFFLLSAILRTHSSSSELKIWA
jgi:dipeptide/tripeptide permease